MFKCEMPSGKTVSVDAPSFRVRMEALKEFKAAKEELGYTAEELLAAKSITSVDGKSINTRTLFDPVEVLYDWGIGDIQYFIEWFMTLFFIEDKMRERASNEAKKLMTGEKSGMKSSSNTPAKV